MDPSDPSDPLRPPIQPHTAVACAVCRIPVFPLAPVIPRRPSPRSLSPPLSFPCIAQERPPPPWPPTPRFPGPEGWTEVGLAHQSTHPSMNGAPRCPSRRRSLGLDMLTAIFVPIVIVLYPSWAEGGEEPSRFFLILPVDLSVPPAALPAVGG